jgi:hypothetical protein
MKKLYRCKYSGDTLLVNDTRNTCRRIATDDANSFLLLNQAIYSCDIPLNQWRVENGIDRG